MINHKSVKVVLLSMGLLPVTEATAAMVEYRLDGVFSMYSGSSQISGLDPITGIINLDITTGLGSGGYITSSVPFFGFAWTSFNLQLLPNVDESVHLQASTDWGANSCPVYSDCIGMEFDWLITEAAIPGVFEFSSLDGDNTGTPGIAMTSGAFIGFSPVFSGTLTAVPLPASIWLFGAALTGLATVSLQRRKIIMN